MPIPALTNLQFFILKSLIRRDAQTGNELKETLENEEVHHSVPAFYYLMKRLESKGLITRISLKKTSPTCNHQIRYCKYKITDKGLDQAKESIKFYCE